MFDIFDDMQKVFEEFTQKADEFIESQKQKEE